MANPTYTPSFGPRFDSLPTISSTGPAGFMPTGQVFYVQSINVNAKDNAVTNGSTPLLPLKTLNYALSQVIPNNGDFIYCMPGHVETVAGAAGLNFAAGIADGVIVYFMGNGADRAMISMATATTAQVVIAANNVTVINPRFVAAIDAVAIAVSITGSDCTLMNVEYLDAAAIATTIQVATTNAAKRLTLNGYTYYESTTGTTKTEAIRIVGGDHHRLTNLNITGSFSTANINNVTTLTTVLVASQLYLNNLSAAGLALAVLTTTTGIIDDSIMLAAAGVAPVTAGNILALNNAIQGSSGAAISVAANGDTSISKSVATAAISSKTLFTIAGGPIEVLEIVGLVTTVIGSVANATKLTWTPTVGGTATDITVGVDINAAAAGDLIVNATSFGTASVIVTTGITTVAQHTAAQLVQFQCAPGAITMANAGNSVTGVILWCMRYRPLSPLCTVI